MLININCIKTGTKFISLEVKWSIIAYLVSCKKVGTMHDI